MAQRTEDQLTRLRVAIVSGRLPPDLGEWLLWQLETRAAWRTHCVREIRRAAALVGKSKKATARELVGIIQIFERYPGLVSSACYPDGSAARIVQQLMRAGDVPRSERQLIRLI